MPRTKANGTQHIQVSVSPGQYEALKDHAEALGLHVNVFIRGLLAQHVPGFPADGTIGGLVPNGKYQRKKLGRQINE